MRWNYDLQFSRNFTKETTRIYYRLSSGFCFCDIYCSNKFINKIVTHSLYLNDLESYLFHTIPIAIASTVPFRTPRFVTQRLLTVRYQLLGSAANKSQILQLRCSSWISNIHFCELQDEHPNLQTPTKCLSPSSPLPCHVCTCTRYAGVPL